MKLKMYFITILKFEIKGQISRKKLLKLTHSIFLMFCLLNKIYFYFYFLRWCIWYQNCEFRFQYTKDILDFFLEANNLIHHICHSRQRSTIHTISASGGGGGRGLKTKLRGRRFIFFIYKFTLLISILQLKIIIFNIFYYTKHQHNSGFSLCMINCSTF